MRPCAIISDIHGNLAALEAVLRDIHRLGIHEIWCLGDMVGYGPQPVECYQRVKEEASIVIMGNHEKALAPGGGERFNARAKRAIDWTRNTIAKAKDGPAMLEEMTRLPTHFTRDHILFVHGSPTDPTDEYIMPRDAADPTKTKRWFEKIEGYVFVGHTHFPGVIEEGQSFIPPEAMMGSGIYMLDGNVKAIINVGSVGQPRDRNPKACYVTFDGDSVVYRRVAYDVEATRKLIYRIPELDRSLGDRIVEGK